MRKKQDAQCSIINSQFSCIYVLFITWHFFFLERAGELHAIILREEKRSKEDQSKCPEGKQAN
jgi:hypothetical protein